MADTDRDSTGTAQGAEGGGPPEEIPLGQRLFDRPFLLLAACIVVMFVFYTGWGLIELTRIPEAPLP